MLALLYNLILIFILPFAYVRLYIKSKKQPEYWQHKAERFALNLKKISAKNFKNKNKNQQLIWIHAVSVGEIRGCQSLINELLKNKSYKLLLTMTTPTGRAVAENLWEKEIQKQLLILNYLPYDVKYFQRKFLKFYQPKIALLMETEIWLNLILECKNANIPTVLINARLSEKSKNNYQKNALFRKLAKMAFENLSLVLAQNDADAQRFLQVGVNLQNLQICGNLKFDVPINKTLVDLGKSWKNFWKNSANAVYQGQRFIFLAASTRDGEEELLLEKWQKLLIKIRILAARTQNRLANPLLVIVPRHPQRFDEIYDLAKNQFNFNVVRRSQKENLKNLSAEDLAEIDILLGDSMGEMVAYYTFADAAVIGGSILNFGGQNLIEAAACGCPLLFCQKHMFNFATAAENALKNQAAINFDEIGEISKFVENNYKDSNLDLYKKNALLFANSYKGATAKTLQILKSKKYL